MLRWRMRIRKMFYMLMDLLAVSISFLVASTIYENTSGEELVLSGFERLSFVIIFMLVYIFCSDMLSVYKSTIENSGKLNLYIIIKTLSVVFMSLVIIAAMMFFWEIQLSRTFLLYYVLILIVSIGINRFILRLFIGSGRHSKHAKSILILGHSERGTLYIEEIKKHSYLNINIIGYISIKENVSYPGIHSLGSIQELESILNEHVVDEIAVARPLTYDSRLREKLAYCQDMGITITMLLETQSLDIKAQVAMVGDLPTLKFHMVSLNETQLFIKRVMDVFGGMIGMIIFAIVFIIIGPLIKMETPGPVIFKQERVGRNGRIFKVWKFRSMGIDAEKRKKDLMMKNEMKGHMFKMEHDPRVTKIGAFIRKTSIDEIPQFYNVLKGDMSLVGTRPPTVNEVTEYEVKHRRRISITPGITGMWQVSGRSDIEDFEEVVRLDEEYIRNWSILLDIKIIFRTFLVVFARRGSK